MNKLNYLDGAYASSINSFLLLRFNKQLIAGLISWTQGLLHRSIGINKNLYLIRINE